MIFTPSSEPSLPGAPGWATTSPWGSATLNEPRLSVTSLGKTAPVRLVDALRGWTRGLELRETGDLGEGFDLLGVAGDRVEQQVGGALRGERFELLADLLGR